MIIKYYKNKNWYVYGMNIHQKINEKHIEEVKRAHSDLYKGKLEKFEKLAKRYCIKNIHGVPLNYPRLLN